MTPRIRRVFIPRQDPINAATLELFQLLPTQPNLRSNYSRVNAAVVMQSILHPVIGPKKEIHNLNGRVALITGGAMGIG